MIRIKRIIILAYIVGHTLLVCAQDIRNVFVEQVGNNIEVSYLLSGNADIKITYSTDGGSTFSPMSSLSGDVGHSITAGRKKIIWDVLNDLDYLITNDLRFKLEIATDPVLCTIANKDFRLSNFLYIYNKNNFSKETSIEDYLQRFINFQLKVKEAEDAGIHKTEEFKKELAGYRAQALPGFMKDSLAMDSMIRLSYKRMQRIRSASHIAIQCPKNADTKTRQKQLALIETARQRVTTGGESFYQVSREVSTDSSTQANNGKLGYIIPFRYVYSLEDAIYNTPIGQVSQVFSTQYGYHIALVEEERDAVEVHVAHIMTTGKEHAKDSIFHIYNQLKRGADFTSLAQKHSKDRGSANRGGDLGWFGRGTMVKPFEDMAFDMYREGSYSEPFETAYGWHIIKYIGIRNCLPLDSLKEQITRNVRRDERYKKVEEAYLQKARAQYSIDPSLSDEQALQYIKEHLEELDSKFRNLVQEYYDGLLLFDISLREIWDKADDTDGLTRYFQANKKRYNWTKPRFRGYTICAVNKQSAEAARRIIQASHPDSVNSYIKKRINIDGKEYVRVEYGVWKQGDNKIVDKHIFNDKRSSYSTDSGFPIVETEGKIISQPENYRDVKALITKDYQDYLENEWEKRLHAKYPVKIYNDVLKTIVQ